MPGEGTGTEPAIGGNLAIFAVRAKHTAEIFEQLYLIGFGQLLVPEDQQLMAIEQIDHALFETFWQRPFQPNADLHAERRQRSLRPWLVHESLSQTTLFVRTVSNRSVVVKKHGCILAPC
jgi:hypothetical protein